MNKTSFGLLAAASVLMLHAGGVFLFMKLRIYAALLTVGAFGCLAGAINFKNMNKRGERKIKNEK